MLDVYPVRVMGDEDGIKEAFHLSWILLIGKHIILLIKKIQSPKESIDVHPCLLFIGKVSFGTCIYESSLPRLEEPPAKFTTPSRVGGGEGKV